MPFSRENDRSSDTLGLQWSQLAFDLISQGRRGVVRMALTSTLEPVAVKITTYTSWGIIPCLALPEHRHVVGKQGVITECGKLLEVRQLCEGGDLFDIVANEKSITLMTSLRWILQITNALAHCQ